MAAQREELLSRATSSLCAAPRHFLPLGAALTSLTWVKQWQPSSPGLHGKNRPALWETLCLGVGGEEVEVEAEEEEKTSGVIPGKPEGALTCQSSSWCQYWAELLLGVQEEVMHKAP